MDEDFSKPFHPGQDGLRYSIATENVGHTVFVADVIRDGGILPAPLGEDIKFKSQTPGIIGLNK